MALLRHCLQELRMRRGEDGFVHEVPRAPDDEIRLGTSLSVGYGDDIEGRLNLGAVGCLPHSSASTLGTGYGVAMRTIEAP